MQTASLFILIGRMSKVYPGYLLMLPPFAKLVFVIKQAQLLYDVVHDEIRVNLRFVSHVLLVGVTQLANLIDVESLVWVHFQHSYH